LFKEISASDASDDSDDDTQEQTDAPNAAALSPVPPVSVPSVVPVASAPPPSFTAADSGVAFWLHKFPEYGQFILLLRVVEGAKFKLVFSSARSAGLCVSYSIGSAEVDELARAAGVASEVFSHHFTPVTKEFSVEFDTDVVAAFDSTTVGHMKVVRIQFAQGGDL